MVAECWRVSVTGLGFLRYKTPINRRRAAIRAKPVLTVLGVPITLDIYVLLLAESRHFCGNPMQHQSAGAVINAAVCVHPNLDFFLLFLWLVRRDHGQWGIGCECC